MKIAHRTAALLCSFAVAAGVSLAGASAHAEERKDLPEVAVIGTGGTISGVSTNRVSFQDYRSGQLAISKMVDELRPEVDGLADVTTEQFGNKGSSGYSIADYRKLTASVDAALKKNDAVVVTTGTDTMEEFAYWLDLTVRSDKPVVLTGSMRPWTVIGTDAPANLYNAIKLAASRKTKCFGTVVMLNDEIQAAREVRKTNALRMDTFESGRSGVLGTVDQDNIRLNRAPARVQKCGKAGWRTPFDLDRIVGRVSAKEETKEKTKEESKPLPKVEIAYSYQDAGGEAIKAFADGGAKGVVTAGTGAGGISPAMSTARTDAVKKGVTFASTTRTGSGAVYDSTGTTGVIGAEDLSPQKARLLLLLSLAATNDEKLIREWFATLGTAQFTTR
ncbi:asparaginase [Streptomyces liliifuscus]|uniref:asparaginase n=1 Tax=Streptomyces liliifuscus TaxID=2797636 RepID=A0A7T7REV2_9ACTN|nr:asparaginase [Streptomyces liliifuscus]QQM44039.1 asparaginase [Streptomyces liliifuscus]